MKKVLSIILSLVMLLSMSITAFAAETTPSENTLNLISPTAETIDVQEPRVPNGIPITSTPRVNGTGIDVHVGNIGVDGLDSVTVTVSATGHSQPKSLTYYVPAIVGKTFSFDFPYIKCATTYNITIQIMDGSGNKTLYRTAELNYTEEALAAMGWGAGTYGTRCYSLERHFTKHHNDGGVGVNNLVAYLAMAINTFNDTLNNPGNYNVVQQTPKEGFEPAHKYTHKTTGLFIIYGDNTDTIYTFGGR